MKRIITFSEYDYDAIVIALGIAIKKVDLMKELNKIKQDAQDEEILRVIDVKLQTALSYLTREEEE
jgi:hypothetical protein